ncbi:hypothetical protein [Flavobacterium sp.]|uniref:hypothetical protein n=1 Tax=Flavobacterium sp. TaxID=239 RepID=UPI003F69856A
MKTKNENKKFTLEKFEVAKLKNMKTIKGGSENGGDDPKTTGNTIYRTLQTVG